MFKSFKSKKNKKLDKLDSGKAATQQLILSEQQQQQQQQLQNNSETTTKQVAEKNAVNSLESDSNKKGKTLCQACKKKCSGEVLRVQDKYFHTECFKCTICMNSLAQGGFFSKDGAYYCTADYQKNFGSKCATCGDYVEGEVVSALGKTYHQKCFTCARCRQPFPSGEKVTYNGKEVVCEKCMHIPVRKGSTPAATSPITNNPNECAGCREELKEGQALVALDRQWHVWCFKCGTCDVVLHGEYMGRDGKPYCEKDYHTQFGVKCAYCNRFISGKVLQAGDNHHFHPTCARCTKCGDPFGDGEEMYLQGGAIWHPRCGPGPTENGQILNGPSETNGHCTYTTDTTRDFDRMSSSGVSDMQFSIRSRTPSLNGSLYSPTSMSRKHYSYRTPSPGLILREYNKSATLADDISRICTYSYLTEEPTQGYLKRPIDPYDKQPMSPHFHRPTSQNSLRGSQGAGGKYGRQSRSGMTVLVDQIRSETPRPKSPHMNNEEPIELAHFPGAKPPNPNEKPKIERDDFPAPPYPYTDPERRKRWSDTYKGVPVSDEEDAVDGEVRTPQEIKDEQLRREEQELLKCASGIGKVFLKDVKEREKLKQWKAANLDPRNASRTPSANKEPTYRLRYESPVGASPSRNLDHPKPFDEDDFDRTISCRSSMGRSFGQIPSYNVVSSLRNVPRPGYGLKTSTLPARNDYGDYYSGMGVKTHSTDFSSGKSDISTDSITDVDRRGLKMDMPLSTTYTGGLGGYPSGYTSQVRRSLPNMAHTLLINEPAKIYPYHLLMITNYRLPADVDRCNLERHLSDAEFESLFQLSRTDFYRLPTWRRSEIKRRARLF